MPASSNTSSYFLIDNCSTGDYLYIFYRIGSVPGTSLIFISSPNPLLGRTLYGTFVGNTSLYFINMDFDSPLYYSSQAESCVTHPSGIPSSA